MKTLFNQLNFRRTATVVALMLLCMAGMAEAGTMTFKAQNFSVDVPGGWKESAPPENMVYSATSPEGKRVLQIAAVTLPEAERETGAGDLLEGFKESLAKEGYFTRVSRTADIGSLSFLEYEGRNSKLGSIGAYVTVAGNEGYLIQFITANDSALPDADFQSVVRSFRLLEPRNIPALSTKGKSPAYSLGYRIGYFVGSAGVLCFPLFLVVVGGVVWLVFFRKKSRRR